MSLVKRVQVWDLAVKKLYQISSRDLQDLFLLFLCTASINGRFGRWEVTVLPFASPVPGVLVLDGQGFRITVCSPLKRRVVNSVDTGFPYSLHLPAYKRNALVRLVLEDPFLSLFSLSWVSRPGKGHVTVLFLQLMKPPKCLGLAVIARSALFLPALSCCICLE